MKFQFDGQTYYLMFRWFTVAGPLRWREIKGFGAAIRQPNADNITPTTPLKLMAKLPRIDRRVACELWWEGDHTSSRRKILEGIVKVNPALGFTKMKLREEAATLLTSEARKRYTDTSTGERLAQCIWTAFVNRGQQPKMDTLRPKLNIHAGIVGNVSSDIGGVLGAMERYMLMLAEAIDPAAGQAGHREFLRLLNSASITSTIQNLTHRADYLAGLTPNGPHCCWKHTLLGHDDYKGCRTKFDRPKVYVSPTGQAPTTPPIQPIPPPAVQTPPPLPIQQPPPLPPDKDAALITSLEFAANQAPDPLPHHPSGARCELQLVFQNPPQGEWVNEGIFTRGYVIGKTLTAGRVFLGSNGFLPHWATEVSLPVKHSVGRYSTEDRAKAAVEEWVNKNLVVLKR